jgi:hypothetical protein
LNVKRVRNAPAETSNLLPPPTETGPRVQKASFRAGSAYGVIFGPPAMHVMHVVPHGNLVSSHAYSAIGFAQDHIGRPIIVRLIRAVPMRRIDLR